jgi:hypothetical protein
MKDEKTIMKERCDLLGSGFSVVFWGIAVIEVLLLISGIWLAFQPATEFSAILTDTPAGVQGIIRFSGLKDGFMAELLSEMTFDPGILNEAAGQMPKYVYLADHFSNVAVGIGVVFFLWYLKEIFRNIKRFETPFIKENSRAIFGMGVALMVILAAKENLFALLTFIKGVGTQGLYDIIDFYWIVPGSVFFCLSAVFEYGRVLQQESDETL